VIGKTGGMGITASHAPPRRIIVANKQEFVHGVESDLAGADAMGELAG
jgi:hypothetical protein